MKIKCSGYVSTSVLIFLFYVVYYTLLNSRLIFKSPVIEFGDLGANVLKIEHAKEFCETLGNYSRWNFNHPGPFYWYLFAGGEFLFYQLLSLVPTPGNAHILTFMIFSLALLTLALHFIARAFANPAIQIWIAVLAMPLFISQEGNFAILWPPYFPVMPLFLTACAALALSQGVASALPVLLASSLIAVHAHVAQPLFVGVVYIFLALCILVSADMRAVLKNKTYVMLGIFCVLLLALPICHDLVLFFQNKDSNLNRILDHMRRPHGESHSWESAFSYCLQFLGPDFDVSSGSLVENCFKQWWLKLPFALVLIGNVVILFFPFRKKFQSPGEVSTVRSFLETRRSLVLISFLLFGAALFWGKIQDGSQRAFNSYFIYGIYFLLCIPIATCLFQCLKKSILVTSSVIVLISTAAFEWEHRGRKEKNTTMEVFFKSDGYKKMLDEFKESPVVFKIEDPNEWKIAAGYWANFKRNSIPFCISPEWEYVAGREYAFEPLIEKAFELGSGIRVFGVEYPSPDMILADAIKFPPKFTISKGFQFDDDVLSSDSNEFWTDTMTRGFHERLPHQKLTKKEGNATIFIPISPESEVDRLIITYSGNLGKKVNPRFGLAWSHLGTGGDNSGDLKQEVVRLDEREIDSVRRCGGLNLSFHSDAAGKLDIWNLQVADSKASKVGKSVFHSFGDGFHDEKLIYWSKGNAEIFLAALEGSSGKTVYVDFDIIALSPGRKVWVDYGNNERLILDNSPSVFGGDDAKPKHVRLEVKDVKKNLRLFFRTDLPPSRPPNDDPRTMTFAIMNFKISEND